jgi:hypothetical protein
MTALQSLQALIVDVILALAIRAIRPPLPEFGAGVFIELLR